MSMRTNLRPQAVIPSPLGSPANGASMAANITSAPTILQSLSKVSYAFSWSGTSPVGTLSAQVSNDYSVLPTGVVNNAGTWNTIPLLLSDGTTATSVAVTGNTGSGFFDISTSAYACRVLYTFTSGVGTLAATVNGKVS